MMVIGIKREREGKGENKTGKKVSKKLDKGKGRGTATDMEEKKWRTKFSSEVTETVYLTGLMFKDIQPLQHWCL